MFFLLKPTTRNHYKKTGSVFSLRSQKRKRTGPDCIAASRNPHMPLGKGHVSLEKTFKKLHPALLKPYLKHSGFKTAEAWIESYASFTRGKVVHPAYLYQVQRLEKPKISKK